MSFPVVLRAFGSFCCRPGMLMSDIYSILQKDCLSKENWKLTNKCGSTDLLLAPLLLRVELYGH